MVGVLKQEQTDDDTKKEWCTGELDSAEDKLKGDMQLIKDTETSIADAKETVNTLSNEITMLVGQVAMLDKDVATATEERKKENAGFKELRSSNGAAKELIEMAKKRAADADALFRAPVLRRRDRGDEDLRFACDAARS